MVLPTTQYKQKFIDHLRSNRVIIVQGGTGCGKTTQLPLAAYQVLSASVVCTQPRRAAATTVATRVAQELGAPLGQLVGYAVRFDKQSTANTKVLFVTEGHLLQKLVPKTKDSGVIKMNRFDGIEILFLDECHEDSKELEVLLFLAREALAARPDFKIVLMSATPDINTLEAYFEDFSVNVLTIPGISFFPVTIDHNDDDEQAQDGGAGLEAELVRLVMQHHNDATQDGDFLVFMPGEKEITDVVAKITSQQKQQQKQQPDSTRQLRVLPFHASQSHAEHELVFEPFPQGRKVIVATNIAESSLTIGNLKMVFDACQQKVKHFDFGMNAMELRKEPACKNALIQRAGRVGRTSSGRVIRMCTEADFEDLPDFNAAAVTRVPIDDVLLKLLMCAPSNVISPDKLEMERFLHSPSPAAEQHALTLLVDLGAIVLRCKPVDDLSPQLRHFKLTRKGRDMSSLPLPSTLAYALVSVRTINGRLPMLKATAMLAVAGTTFVMPRYNPENPGLVKRAQQAHSSFKTGSSDQLALVNALHAYQQQPEDNRDSWCATNFLNAHTLHEANSVFGQLLSTMHSLFDWSTNDTNTFKCKNVGDDLCVALLEAYTENIAVRCHATHAAHQAEMERIEEGCQDVDEDQYWIVWSGQKITLPRKSSASPKGSNMASSSKNVGMTPPLVMFAEANKKGSEFIMFQCSAVKVKTLKLSERFKKAFKKYGSNISDVVRKRMVQEGVALPDA